MSQKYYTLLTTKGAALLANATALGTPLKLTHMAVGDGNGAIPQPVATQTKLVHEVRRAAINTLFIDENNPNQIIAEQVIPETDGGWFVHEIGLFDDKGNLIAVGNCPSTYKPQLVEGSGRMQVIRMIIIVDNVDSVEIKIDPSVVLATRQYVDDALTAHAKSTDHPDATTKSKGFVRLNSSTDSQTEDDAATPKAVNDLKLSSIVVWDEKEKYKTNQIVSFNGALYVSITNNNISNNPVTDNENWILLIDSNQISFNVICKGGKISSGVNTKVPNSNMLSVSVQYNNGQYWDEKLSKFTAPKNGEYSFVVSWVSDIYNVKYIEQNKHIRIFKNGSWLTTRQHWGAQSSDGRGAWEGTFHFSLKKGDYIEIYLLHNTGETMNLLTDDGAVTISGVMLK